MSNSKESKSKNYIIGYWRKSSLVQLHKFADLQKAVQYFEKMQNFASVVLWQE
jgi:hypothetical protein